MAYSISVVCENCGWSGVITITDGELIDSQKCPTCKCGKITKQYGASAYRKEG